MKDWITKAAEDAMDMISEIRGSKPMNEQKKCPDCHGSGLLDEREQPPTPCPACNGSGNKS